MPVENPTASDPANCEKMDPKVVWQVEEHDVNGDPVADSWITIGCCITSDTPPSLQRNTTADDQCMNFDCDDPTADVCSGPAESSPADQQEATADFEVPYYPAVGSLTEWFESMQRCGERRRWRKCYPNGTKQVLSCGFVSSHVPSTNTPGGGKAKATVTIALCGDWSYA